MWNKESLIKILMMLPTIKTMTSIEYKIAMKMTIMKTKRLVITMMEIIIMIIKIIIIIIIMIVVIIMIIICTSTTITLIV